MTAVMQPEHLKEDSHGLKQTWLWCFGPMGHSKLSFHSCRVLVSDAVKLLPFALAKGLIFSSILLIKE